MRNTPINSIFEIIIEYGRRELICIFMSVDTLLHCEIPINFNQGLMTDDFK